MMKRVLGSLFLDGCLKSVRLGLRISVYLDDHFLDDQTRHCGRWQAFVCHRNVALAAGQAPAHAEDQPGTRDLRRAAMCPIGPQVESAGAFSGAGKACLYRGAAQGQGDLQAM